MATEGHNVLSQKAVQASPMGGTGVYDNFDQLTDEIERLAATLTLLGEKLGPVLRDSEATGTVPSEAIDPNSSTLAFNIAQRAARIRELRGAVTDVISRIDL